jgi:putative membrane protein
MAGQSNILEKKEPYQKLIAVLSIIIPVVIAVLFGMPKIKGYNTSFLPPIYASVNALTAVLLVVAFIAIRQGKRKLHERLMKTCIGLSASFLVMYVAYHLTSESTSFGGQGGVRYFYFFILITHILLSIGVIPFVLFTFVRALAGNFERHRKLARITFPIWLYVAVTGVIVYLMISPYYVH